MRLVVLAGTAALLGIVALAVAMSQRGDAAFPGLNGKIVFSNGQSYASQSIYAANSDGSSPIGLTSSTNDYSPSYSADGSKIAFNRNNNIVVMNSDGSGLVQIATGARAENTTSTWQSEYEIPRNGGEEIVVKIETRTRKGYGFYSPVFTADGTQLAVAEYVFDRTQESVCAVENVGETECLDYEDPNAYFHYHSECKECFEHIVMISSSTGAVTAQVTPKTAEVSDFSPAVSATGMIAFARYARGSSGASGIFVVNSPGAAPAQLTSGYGNYGPDFSPDSTKIVFSHNEREFGVIGVGGGPIALITLPLPPAGSFEYVESPKYSPDGTQIVFYRSLYHPPSTEERGLFVMGANGSSPHRIAEGYDPNWQPVPPPPPPTPAKGIAKKGKVKLNKKNEAVIGTITCGSSPCALKLLSSKLKAGKKKCSAKIKLPKNLAAGKSTPVKVKVVGKCLAALKKAHKGSLVTKIQITDALGKKVLTLKSTLIPGKGKKTKKGKK